jgi:hypothetical protein
MGTHSVESGQYKNKHMASFISLTIILIVIGLMIIIGVGVSSTKVNAEDGNDSTVIMYYGKTFNIYQNGHLVSSYPEGNFKVTKELSTGWQQVEFDNIVNNQIIHIIWVFSRGTTYDIK